MKDYLAEILIGFMVACLLFYVAGISLVNTEFVYRGF
jgi:hypothetical protein